MTDKEEQIEEMARDWCCTETCNGCPRLQKNGYCVWKFNAEILIANGYRKIPEGAVILTKVEYEKLKLLPEKVHEEMTERLKAEIAIEKRIGEDNLKRFENNVKNVFEIEKENARKETAKEILTKLFNIRQYSEYGDIYYFTQTEGMQKIFKEYGVEVEE